MKNNYQATDKMIVLNSLEMLIDNIIPSGESYDRDVLDAIYDLFEKYHKNKQWISVEERLPETQEHYYNCLVNYGKSTIMAYFDNNSKSFVNMNFQDIVVTHWMTLPELPEK